MENSDLYTCNSFDGRCFCLLLAGRSSLTQTEVDREITVQNAAIVQRLTDLSGQVGVLMAEVDKLRDEENQRSRH